jgi:hypothetical protein
MYTILIVNDEPGFQTLLEVVGHLLGNFPAKTASLP